MTMLELVKHLNFAVVVLFTLLYLYQGFYVVVGLVCRRWQDRHQPSRLHRFAVIVSARNEEGVIGELLESLNRQNYPKELLDLYVVADNCTDDTAGVARRAGAFVYERFDQVHKGKGYAMDYLFRRLKEEGKDCYDGYFVFDADNLVDANFVAEMNRTFDQGYDAVTCYRNSKNFAANWISAGYSIWFLREARFLNFPRTLLGTNCHVSGTGFLVSARVIEDNGGWPFHLLTEDIQFSVDCAIQGKKIGYCDKAVVYDEHPPPSVSPGISGCGGLWASTRWIGSIPSPAEGLLPPGPPGYLLLRHVCHGAPGLLLTLLMILFNGVILAACLTQPAYLATRIIHETVGFMGSAVWNFYVGLLFYGLITVLSEWRHIDAAPVQKLGYVLTFPIFMFTYIPISIAALVQKVEWKPIYHTATKKINELG
ncbi:MAG: glycosyltransferase family 2 protein [Flavonifractor plautii]